MFLGLLSAFPDRGFSMKLKKYIHIRNKTTEKQQIIPLYSLKEDVGNKAVNLLSGEDVVYAKLGTPGESLSSKLIFCKRDRVYAAQKLDEADTIPLNRFYHIVKYDSKLHETFLEKTDAFAKKMLEAKTSDELTKYDAERGRFQHLARITDFSSTLYRGDHEELPNPLDTSDLDDTAYMFYGCTKLKTIPELDLSHVMDMRSMFKNCKSLPEVFPWYINATRMDEIEKYRDMFRGSSVRHAYFKNPPACVRDLIPRSAELMGLEDAFIVGIILSKDKYKMKDLYPDTYQTATTFDGPFGVFGMDTIEEIYDGCEKLTDPVPFETYGIHGFERMFQNCASLPEDFPYVISISSIGGAGDLTDMFKGTPVKRVRFSTSNPPTAYDITGTILGNGAYSTIEATVTNEKHHMKEIFPGWYDKMTTSTLKTTDTSEFELVPYKLTDMSLMFEDCSSLTQMDSQRILALNGITNMNSMFYNCSSLTETPALDTSSCEDMASMYRGCFSLTSVEKMNTMAARDISYMFYGCKKLPKTISNAFDVEHIAYKEGFKQMFGDTSVEEISFLDAEPSVRNQVTPSWFGNSVKKVNWLAALDWVVKDSTLRKLDLYDAVVIRNTEHSLCEIEGLESVNEIIFENIEDASRAIGDCKKLETIGKITGTGNVKNMANMFAGCRSLVSLPAIDIKSIESAESMRDMLAGAPISQITFMNASDKLKTELTPEILGDKNLKIIYA